MSALNKTVQDGTVIWKVVKRVPDPPVYTPENLGVYTKSEVYTKNEIDELLDKYLLKTGGTITGSLVVNENLVVSKKLVPTSLVVPSAKGEGNFWIA